VTMSLVSLLQCTRWATADDHGCCALLLMQHTNNHRPWRLDHALHLQIFEVNTSVVTATFLVLLPITILITLWLLHRYAVVEHVRQHHGLPSSSLADRLTTRWRQIQSAISSCSTGSRLMSLCSTGSQQLAAAAGPGDQPMKPSARQASVPSAKASHAPAWHMAAEQHVAHVTACTHKHALGAHCWQLASDAARPWFIMHQAPGTCRAWERPSCAAGLMAWHACLQGAKLHRLSQAQCIGQISDRMEAFPGSKVVFKDPGATSAADLVQGLRSLSSLTGLSGARATGRPSVPALLLCSFHPRVCPPPRCPA